MRLSSKPTWLSWDLSLLNFGLIQHDWHLYESWPKSLVICEWSLWWRPNWPCLWTASIRLESQNNGHSDRLSLSLRPSRVGPAPDPEALNMLKFIRSGIITVFLKGKRSFVCLEERQRSYVYSGCLWCGLRWWRFGRLAVQSGKQWHRSTLQTTGMGTSTNQSDRESHQSVQSQRLISPSCCVMKITICLPCSLGKSNNWRSKQWTGILCEKVFFEIDSWRHSGC